MPGYGYATRANAIQAAEEAMRRTFEAEVRFEPFPHSVESFRVLDGKGNHLQPGHALGVVQRPVGPPSWPAPKMLPAGRSYLSSAGQPGREFHP
jgi:hypothetical protein